MPIGEIGNESESESRFESMSERARENIARHIEMQRQAREYIARHKGTMQRIARYQGRTMHEDEFAPTYIACKYNCGFVGRPMTVRTHEVLCCVRKYHSMSYEELLPIYRRMVEADMANE
jgi:hypothetical protein